MPSQKQEFNFPELSSEQLLVFAYGTFKDLGWTLKYAGPNAIIGYTPRSWNKYEDEVLIGAAEGILTVTSSLIHNESFDLTGKNKKHIRDFIAAFEKVKAKEPQTQWAQAIESLRQETVSKAKEEVKNSEEIEKIMKISSGTRYVTYTIISINILVFFGYGY